MSDSLIGSVFRVMLYLLLLIFLVVTMLFVYNVGTMNSFISNTNSIVSRSGGLTKSAYDRINKMSTDHYHGMFHVSYKPVTRNPLPDRYDRDGAVTRKDGESNLKGFDDNGSKAGTYWQTNQSTYKDSQSQGQPKSSSQTNYGQPVTYHVYMDIPYDPPFAQNLALHTGVKGKPSNNSSLPSIAERVDSEVRPGSQE